MTPKDISGFLVFGLELVRKRYEQKHPMTFKGNSGREYPVRLVAEIDESGMFECRGHCKDDFYKSHHQETVMITFDEAMYEWQLSKGIELPKRVLTCSRCGAEYELAWGYAGERACTMPVTHRTSGICGGSVRKKLL